jgi:hypothetical protein
MRALSENGGGFTPSAHMVANNEARLRPNPAARDKSL